MGGTPRRPERATVGPSSGLRPILIKEGVTRRVYTSKGTRELLPKERVKPTLKGVPIFAGQFESLGAGRSVTSITSPGSTSKSTDAGILSHC